MQDSSASQRNVANQENEGMHASNDTNNQNLTILDDQNPNPRSIEETARDPSRVLNIQITRASNESYNQNHRVPVDQSPNPQSTQAAPGQPRVNEEAEEINFSVRTALLTVAVLLAAATYQTAYNPPGGLWQEDDPDTVHVVATPSSAAQTTVQHPAGPVTGIKKVAGVSILGTKHKNFFIAFIFGNTLGFLFSMVTIEDLTRGLTRRLEMSLAIAAISITYGISVSVISPSEYRPWIAVTVFAAFAVVLILRIRRERVLRARLNSLLSYFQS